MKPLILDSALGTELENRGEYLPSFKTSIWSAYSLIHNPEVIMQIHIDNIEAGADVITKSNYQATPELLKTTFFAKEFLQSNFANCSCFLILYKFETCHSCFDCL